MAETDERARGDIDFLEVSSKKRVYMSRIIDFLAKDENYRVNADFPVPVEQAANATFYHCKRHDYIFYPETVENAEGVRYRAGYYDETGKYYKELMVFRGVAEEGITCKYCGYRMQATEIEDMEDLKCPNCDASFELLTPATAVKKDKVVTSEVNFTGKMEAEAKRYVHMPDNRVVSTGYALRQRSAYDPNYDIDMGTDFDKTNDLDERRYERFSFGQNQREFGRLQMSLVSALLSFVFCVLLSLIMLIQSSCG